MKSSREVLKSNKKKLESSWCASEFFRAQQKILKTTQILHHASIT